MATCRLIHINSSSVQLVEACVHVKINLYVFSVCPGTSCHKHDLHVIGESVDSLCRDGTDTPIVHVHTKAF